MNDGENMLKIKNIILVSGETCPMCRRLKKTLESLNLKPDEIKVLDTDKDKEFIETYNIQTLPVLLKLLNGKEVDRITGVVPPSELEKFFNE